MKIFYKKIYTLFLFIGFYCGASGQNPQLWGTTALGGASNKGTIVKINGDGTGFAMVHSFTSMTGTIPNGTFIQAANGKLYGLARDGGINNNGVLFSFDPTNNSYTDEFDFNGTNGDEPHDELLAASNGNFYGTTGLGGANNYGVLFSFDPTNNAFANLYDFTLANGITPVGSLIQANNSQIYGMTIAGGTNNFGVIFSFDLTNNTYTDLYNFTDVQGSFPVDGLIQFSGNGKLYGMTGSGGANAQGVLFSYDITTNTFIDLFDFNGLVGSSPIGSLLEASNGILYGLTQYGGTNNAGNIFSFDPQNNVCTNLFSFIGTNGLEPNGNLIQASDGKLYGATSLGGATGAGIIFSFDITNNAFTNIFDFNGTNGQLSNGSFVELTLTGITGYNSVIHNLSITPNPTAGLLNIKNFNSLNIKSIFIYNSIGEKVKSLQATKTIFIGDLPSGLYLVQLRKDSEIRLTQKILLDR